MRVPPDDPDDAQILRCQCCFQPIYEKKYNFGSSIESISRVSISVSLFFQFLRFLSDVISNCPGSQFPINRN